MLFNFHIYLWIYFEDLENVSIDSFGLVVSVGERAKRNRFKIRLYSSVSVLALFFNFLRLSFAFSIREIWLKTFNSGKYSYGSHNKVSHDVFPPKWDKSVL